MSRIQGATLEDVIRHGGNASAAARAGMGARDRSGPHGRFHLEIDDPVFGKYSIDADNMLTTAGKNLLLTSGPGTLYMGLIAENRHVGDGVITAQPTTTLSSATAAFVAGDVGRNIKVFSGLAGPADFAGTIASQTGTACVVSANLTLNGTSLIISIGPLIAAADVASSHAGWAELAGALITNATRPQWNYGAASAGAITGGTTPAAFTMANAITTQYIHGIFTISVATIGGTTGTLFSVAEFGSPSAGALAISQNATITPTYTVTLT